jgi:hypothetical protein
MLSDTSNSSGRSVGVFGSTLLPEESLVSPLCPTATILDTGIFVIIVWIYSIEKINKIDGLAQ